MGVYADNSPFVKIVLSWIIGILICEYGQMYIAFQLDMPLITSISFLFLFVLWIVRQIEIAWSILFILFNVLLACMYTYHTEIKKQYDIQSKIKSDKAYRFEGITITQPTLRFDTWQAIIEVSSSGTDREQRILCKIPAKHLKTTWLVGDTIIHQSYIRKLPKAKNPGAFDALSFYRYQGIHSSTYVSSPKKLNIRRGIQPLWIQWRNRLNHRINKWITDPHLSSVGSALLLGIKDQLPLEIRHAYAKAGVMHILALSGMHIGILLLFVQWILSRIFLYRFKKTQRICSLIIIWCYVLLTGCSASVIRSATMFSILSLAPLFNKRHYPINTLALSACIMLIIHPYYLFQIGFQLSYLAVLGIFILYKPLVKTFHFSTKIGQFLWKGISVSLAAQLFTLPLCLYYFHQFASYFWLSSLIIGMTATLFMVSGFIAMSFCWLPFLDPIFSFLLSNTLHIQNAVVYTLNALPYALIESIWLSPMMCCLLVLQIGLISLLLIRKSKKWIHLNICFAVFCCSLWMIEDGWSRSKNRLSFFYHYKNMHITLSKNRSSISLYSDLSIERIEKVQDAHLAALRIYDRQFSQIENAQCWHSFFHYLRAKQDQRIIFLPFQIDSIPSNVSANNFLIVMGHKKIRFEELQAFMNCHQIIYDGQLSSKSDKILKDWSARHNIELIDISTHGFYEICL